MNMRKKIEDIIQEISDLLEKKYSSFQGIYLFGSRSYQNSSENSDVDIAVVFNRDIDRNFKNEIIDLIYDFDLEYDLIFDVKILSKNEISNPTTPFRSLIKENGIYYGV